MRLLSAFALVASFVLVLSAPSVTATQGQSGTRVVCTVVNNSGTSLTAFTGTGCVGRDAQTALLITSITASASVIATTTTDQQLTLKYGTGSACGTSTTTAWSAYNLAFAPLHATFNEPLRIPGGNDLCWIHAATGSKTFIVVGYLAPQ